MALTREQQRALALARARLRLQQQTVPASEKPAFEREAEETLSYTPAELIAGSAPTRFALGAASPFLGLAQLAARNPIGRALGQDQWIDERIRSIEALKRRGMEAYGQEGADVIGMGGTLMSPAALGVMKLPLAASTGGRIGQGAAIGAGFGAASPVTGDEFEATKAAQIGTGALLGGVIPGGIEGGKTVLRGARNVLDPWLPGGIERAVGRTAVAAAGDKRAAIIAALEANRQIVPGSRPTAGEAAASAGSAEFSGLQRVVEPRRPSAYDEIAKAQEAARRGQITDIGKDPAALTSAVEARSAAAGPLYRQAIDEGVSPEAAQMLRPQIKNLLERAPRGVLEKAKELARLASEAKTPAGSVSGLHYLKLAVDDLLSKPGDSGFGSVSRRSLAQFKDDLLTVIDELSPTYAQARQTFAQHSIPINRMQVGQELEKALTSPLGVAERPAAFAGAVREAPRTLKRATGQSRFETLDEVLSQQQSGSVRNVLEDLKRSGEYERLSRLGAEKARDLVGQVAPAMPAAGMFNPKYSVLRAISNRLAGRVEGKSLDRLAEAMENPALMAKLMRAASPSERAALLEALLAQRLGRGAIIGGSLMSSQMPGVLSERQYNGVLSK